MKKQNLHTILSLKKEGLPITMLTAYDSSFAKLISESGVEAILVGDSLGMVMQGNSSTVPVTMENMIYHTQCVAKGNQGAFIISDLPYMSYSTPTQTLSNAAKLMQAGANMVKLEGGDWLLETITQLTERGVPVCAHLGLTPQSVDIFGGYKVQGRESKSAEQMLKDAESIEKAGAKMIVFECIPQQLAKAITKQLNIPTIGIGAGKDTDGQVLVLQDMLGLNPGFKPSFVRNFMQDTKTNSIEDAIKLYVSEVKNRNFPTNEHSFN
ncbi:3-methyl-2-oxobutanoate hydroxymethyltransferase [Aliikangiella sp. IMCC44359]|uniref:3-methyl-2-oxobutanoate hydroxymethyltransferase n=1 Tax=Aliikangiella sp. IMCC44359 TaxID=3459125 RepID=UPI00403B18EB